MWIDGKIVETDLNVTEGPDVISKESAYKENYC